MTKPPGHYCWVFHGRDEFEGRVASLLSDSIVRGDRVVVISDDPRPRQWPEELMAEGSLLLAETDQVYGSLRDGDLAALGELVAVRLRQALDEGYRGITAITDNTSFAADPRLLEIWLQWERASDAYISTQPVTSVCAFDGTRISTDVQRRLHDVHSSGRL